MLWFQFYIYLHYQVITLTTAKTQVHMSSPRNHTLGQPVTNMTPQFVWGIPLRIIRISGVWGLLCDGQMWMCEQMNRRENNSPTPAFRDQTMQQHKIWVSGIRWLCPMAHSIIRDLYLACKSYELIQLFGNACGIQRGDDGTDSRLHTQHCWIIQFQISNPLATSNDLN